MSAPAAAGLRPCPLCGGSMPVEDVQCALSRYCHASICSGCGQIEAFTLSRLNDNPNARTCLYFDPLMGIALVNETEAGYVPIWAKPTEGFAPGYVEAVNSRVGIDRNDVMTIVGRSMALGRS